LCFAPVVFAAIPVPATRPTEPVLAPPQLTARAERPLPVLLAPCLPDLPATAYLPCRPPLLWLERALSNLGRAGAISSTADQSLSVVSAVLADVGALSLAK
jgi:hypothetical protein